jgi:uridine phosphorylase
MACYHTDMWLTPVATGVTSAGRLVPLAEPPYFVLIEAALRDEGTSAHYAPPARWAHAPAALATTVASAAATLPEPVLPGRSWTTDAPYRETETAITGAVEAGAVCVEMESAALYASPPPAAGFSPAAVHRSPVVGEGDGQAASAVSQTRVASRSGR